MTKPREKTREELTAEIEDGKKKIRQLENREKVLRQKLSQTTQHLQLNTSTISSYFLPRKRLLFFVPIRRKERPPMTKPREKTREEVTAEIEDGKKKIRQHKKF